MHLPFKFKGDITVSGSLSHLAGLQLLILTAGIMKVVEALSWIFEHNGFCTPFRLYTLCLITSGLGQLQFAWASLYEYRIWRWKFWKFGLACTTPLIYLISTEILIPSERSAGLKFVDVYRTQIWKVAILWAIAQVVNVTMNTLFHRDEKHLEWQNLLRLVALIPLWFLTFPYPEWRLLHEGAVWLILAMTLIYCFFLTPPVYIHSEQKKQPGRQTAGAGPG